MGKLFRFFILFPIKELNVEVKDALLFFRLRVFSNTCSVCVLSFALHISFEYFHYNCTV
jgi:hypothetical protein